MQERSSAIQKRGGALISTLVVPDKQHAQVLGIRVGRYTAQPNAAQLQEIAEVIDSGKVKLFVDLPQAADAQQRRRMSISASKSF